MKKTLALFLAMTLVLTTMTACTKPGAGNSPTPGTSGAEEGSKVIRFAHTYDPNSESGKGPHEWVQAGIAKFEAENPEYTVEEEYYGMN